jgi:hypothetical protein
MFRVTIVLISSGEENASTRSIGCFETRIYMGCLLERHFMSLVPASDQQVTVDISINSNAAVSNTAPIVNAEPQQKKKKLISEPWNWELME